ncbi:MAG: HNH endonuclease [Planctomycetes bacterium]|nr:HNH endonuclease [Planctomycetota bacterium]
MTEDESSTFSLTAQAQRKRVRRPTRRCEYPDCGEWAWARGFCGSHYQKMKREGNLPTVRIVGDLYARFDASYTVSSENGCWEWTGWIHPKGYGILPVGEKAKKLRAHRISYERFIGPIPEGQMALHRCDNRKCVNPEHVFLGDNGANIRDCVEKRRHGAQTGTSYLKITRPMAATIRVLFARGQHSMVALALIYGVDHRTISNILNGRSHLR